MIQWKIKQIFDGDYGCEELKPGEKPKVSVTLIDDDGNEKYVSVEDEWLTENELEVGDRWPLIHVRYGVIVANKRSERYIIAVSDVAEYPIVISRIVDEKDPFDDGGYYGFYDGVKGEQANDILDLLRDNEKTKGRTKLRKTLEKLGPYVDGVGPVVLDDLIPDEWYDAWKDMEGIVTAEKHIDGYWDKNIMVIYE